MPTTSDLVLVITLARGAHRADADRRAATWPPCSRASARCSPPCWRLSSAASTASAASTPPESRLGALRGRADRVLARLHRAAVPAPATPGRPAPQPDGRRGPLPRPGLQHRGQLRDQHELAELRGRDRHVPPRPDGRADRPELRVRGGRASRSPSRSCAGWSAASATTIGSFWVDLVRATLYILLPVAFVAALLLVAQGVIQTLDGPVTADTITGGHADDRARPHREPGGDQGAGHQRRRVRSTPTPPTRSRTPRRSRTGSSSCSSCSSRSGSPRPSAAWPATARQGWVLFAAMAIILVGFGAVAVGAELRVQPAVPGGHRPGGRQPGGQGDALRGGRQRRSSRPSPRAPAPVP